MCHLRLADPIPFSSDIHIDVVISRWASLHCTINGTDFIHPDSPIRPLGPVAAVAILGARFGHAARAPPNVGCALTTCFWISFVSCIPSATLFVPFRLSNVSQSHRRRRRSFRRPYHPHYADLPLDPLRSVGCALLQCSGPRLYIHCTHWHWHSPFLFGPNNSRT